MPVRNFYPSIKLTRTTHPDISCIRREMLVGYHRLVEAFVHIYRHFEPLAAVSAPERSQELVEATFIVLVSCSSSNEEQFPIGTEQEVQCDAIIFVHCHSPVGDEWTAICGTLPDTPAAMQNLAAAVHCGIADRKSPAIGLCVPLSAAQPMLVLLGLPYGGQHALLHLQEDHW